MILLLDNYDREKTRMRSGQRQAGVQQVSSAEKKREVLRRLAR